MSKDGKHHHTPVFYLKQWAASDGKICEYKQRYHGVLPKRVYPDATGYVHGLYSVPGLPREDVQYVEKKFMSRVDNDAAIALRAMLDETRLDQDLPDTLKVAWAQFLYSLAFRSPNVLQRMQKDMEDRIAAGLIHRPKIPFKAAEVFPSMLTSNLVIPELLSMRWVSSTLSDATYPLLTSDRPVMMTNGILHADAHIALPISPRAFFLAVRTDEMFRYVASLSQNELATLINDSVTKQAMDFVYAFDDHQTTFIQKRFGLRVRSTPLD